MNKIVRISVGLTALSLLVACEGGLKGGPDEFSVIPSKELVFPDNFTDLPEPNASARNRADQNPNGDGVEALGGNAAALDSDKIKGNEQALLNATGRYGRPSGIRQTVAKDDEEFRKRNRGKPLERLFGVDTATTRYEDQILDPYQELERLRKRGIRTPTAPPAE